MSSQLSISLPQSRSSIRVIKRRVSGRELLPPEGDLLAIEDPLNIVLRSGGEDAGDLRPLVMTMRTPGDDVAMVHGFLFAEGIVSAEPEEWI